MSIHSITTDFAGQIGVAPRLVRLTCTDTYAQITALNYLQSTEHLGFTIQPTDFIFISYVSGGFGIFTPSFTSSGVTLNPYLSQGNVTLPVVNDNIPAFSGTTGLIDDSGIAAANIQLASTIKCGNLVYAGGSTTFSLTLTGATTNGIVLANFYSQTNPSNILTVGAGANAIIFTTSADPGGSNIHYIYFSASQ